MTVAPLEAEFSKTALPPVPLGNSKLATMALGGLDLAPVWNSLVGRVNKDPNDAAAFLDLATIAYIQGRPDDRARLRTNADFSATVGTRRNGGCQGSRVHGSRPLSGEHAD
jgi:hypothetical protein